MTALIADDADAGIDKDAKDAEGWTALHVASFMNRAEATAKLLDAGADVDATTTDRQLTALQLACSRGHVAIVKLLVSHRRHGHVAASEGAAIGSSITSDGDIGDCGSGCKGKRARAGTGGEAVI